MPAMRFRPIPVGAGLHCVFPGSPCSDGCHRRLVLRKAQGWKAAPLTAPGSVERLQRRPTFYFARWQQLCVQPTTSGIISDTG